MTGASGLGGAAGALFTQPTHATSKIGVMRSRSRDEGDSATGAGEPGQSSARISGLGQLFSNLQQLHTENPAQFAELAARVAGTLQSASQQQSGPANQLLAQLADSLKQSAITGSLPESNRTNGTETQSYSRTGQPVSSTAVPGIASAPASGLPELFKELASQVSAALGA